MTLLYTCVMLVIFAVNVDEWLKSANSLSPNGIEAGKIFLLQLFCILSLFFLAVRHDQVQFL